MHLIGILSSFTITKRDTFYIIEWLRATNHLFKKTELISCAFVQVATSIVIATPVILRHTSLSVASLRAISVRCVLAQRNTLFHITVITVIRSRITA